MHAGYLQATCARIYFLLNTCADAAAAADDDDDDDDICMQATCTMCSAHVHTQAGDMDA